MQVLPQLIKIYIIRVKEKQLANDESIVQRSQLG